MDPPRNAKKMLRVLIEELLEQSISDPDRRYDSALKYTNAIIDCGYDKLKAKYNIATTKELLHCESVFSDYQMMFEKVGMILRETDALQRLRKKLVTPSDLFEKPIDYFAPDANKDIRDVIAERLNAKIDHKTSKLYVCTKCGKNDAIVTEKQIARGDEPPTVKLECIHCENKWQSKF